MTLALKTVPSERTITPSTEGEIAAFRNAMRYVAGAVSVVTTGEGTARTGFTATSIASFSIEPPTVIVCLNRSSSSWPVLQEHGAFCVNLLSQEQSHIADRFAGRGGAKGVERYEGGTWGKLVTGALALADALAVVDCDLEESIERHSHSILIGRVRALSLKENAEPLLYWHGAYRLMSSIDRVLLNAQ